MATIENFRHCDLFKNVTDSELKEILSLCRDKTFQPGSNICGYGEKGDEFFVLLDGELELITPTDKDYGLAVVFAEIGNAFGYSALLEPYTYAVTAKCLTGVKVAAIEIEHFLDFVANRNAKLGYAIMRNLARIFMQRNQFIEELYAM